MRGSLGPGELGRRGLQQTAYPVDSDTGGMRGLFTEVWAGAGAGQVEGCPPGEMGARSDAAGEAWGAGLVQSLRPCACCWEHTGQGPRVLVRSVRPHRRGLPVPLIFRHPLGSRGFWEHLCRTQVKRSAHFKSLLRTPLTSSPGPSCRPVDHPRSHRGPHLENQAVTLQAVLGTTPEVALPWSSRASELGCAPWGQPHTDTLCSPSHSPLFTHPRVAA